MYTAPFATRSNSRLWISSKRFARRLDPLVLNQLLFPVAKRFVSGQTIEEAAAAVRHLNANGIGATLDLLGENVADRPAADTAVTTYLKTLDFIKKEGLSSNVSLKLTQMGLDIDRSYCLE